MINRKCAAALLAAAMLLPTAACALAQETAPLAGHAQTEQIQTQERLSPFGTRRSYAGVAASSQWLLQVKLGNRLLNMRMFTPEGEQIVLQEKLTAGTGEGEIRLLLRAGDRSANLLLQMDQDAADTLLKLGITEIVVADMDLHVQAKYHTRDLLALRSLFSVGENELLCVSGEMQPVTVVSVDGVRRQITK